MKRRIIITIVMVIIVVAGYLHFKASSSKQPPPTTIVEYTNIKHNITAVGNILPVQSVIVNSPIPGIVGTIAHDDGEYVKAGDPLLTVTPNPSPSVLAQYIADVSQDKATLSSAQTILSNDEYLLENKIIPENYNVYLSDKENVATAKAKLDYDQQKLNLIQSGNTIIDGKEVNNTIPSPISGFILQRNVDVGSPVIALGDTTYATTLFTIADMNNLIFKGTVDETDTNNLKMGLKAQLTLAADPNTSINGTVSNLSLQSDAENALTSDSSSSDSPFDVGFQIEINQLNIPKSITMRSGYSATATLTTAEAKHVLSIPERIITFKNNKTYVKKLSEDKHIQMTEIKTGLSDGVNIEITKGLAEGDHVVDPEKPNGSDNNPRKRKMKAHI